MVASVQSGTSSCYPILSIDGGGVRGVIPATMLVEIEKISGRPISKLFRLVGGTSTGGILALGLVTPKEDGTPKFSAQDLLDLYTDPASLAQMFRKNPAHQTPPQSLALHEKIEHRIRYPKYLPPDLLLREKFAEALVSQALTEVLVTATSVDQVAQRVFAMSTSALSAAASLVAGAAGVGGVPLLSSDSLPRKVYLFTTKGLKTLSYSYENLGTCQMDAISEKAFYMRHVARATSAAPSYFLPSPYRDFHLLDGGCVQNNPALASVLEARAQGVALKDMKVVSLGTGQTESFEDPVSMLFEFSQPSDRENQALESLGVSSFRFQHLFPGKAPELDDFSPETLGQLKEAGRAMVDRAVENDFLRILLQSIAPDSL